MQYTKLGSSGLKVSHVCLGSMTWGQQNTQQDADQQIDYALAQGINFIDTAELYSVPPRPETYGATEEIIGNWLARNPGRRNDFILASKISGQGLPYIRDGSAISGMTVKQALDDSLKRLQTDYIDLYQLHWPNRITPHFGKHWPGMSSPSTLNAEQEQDNMLDILRALDDSIKAGKIRFCGLSDDTPWGIETYLKLSAQYDLPKMVSIQNELSLLHMKDWPYLLETCVMNDVAYLPWSPLAGGVLSGKYDNGVVPEDSRWALTQRNGLFRDTPQVHAAVAAYKDVAEKHKLSPVELALAWCRQVDGVTSTIIGATSLEQLKHDISAFEINLSQEALQDVSAVIKQYPMPF